MSPSDSFKNRVQIVCSENRAHWGNFKTQSLYMRKRQNSCRHETANACFACTDGDNAEFRHDKMIAIQSCRNSRFN
jgi:hypothetical protein